MPQYHLGVWSHISGQCVGLGLQSASRKMTMELDEEPFIIPGFQTVTQAVLEGMIWLGSYLEHEALEHVSAMEKYEWTIYINDLYCFNAVTRYLEKWAHQDGMTSRKQQIQYWPRWKGLYFLLRKLPAHFHLIWQYVPEHQYRTQTLTEVLHETVQKYMQKQNEVKAVAASLDSSSVKE